MAEAVPAPFDRPDQGFNHLPGWTWVGTYGGYYLQADLLAGFEHGFFTRQWQGRGPQELAAQLSAGITVHRLQQVHGGLVLPAEVAAAEPWPEADGLVSSRGGQSLWVCGADCTPALVADLSRGVVAACHAGWRGVAARILPEAVAQLQASGSQLADLRVALGPAVSGDHYQVQEAVGRQVAAALDPAARPETDAALEPLLQELAAQGALGPDPEPGHRRLDIRLAAVAQLRRLGLEPSQIAVCPLCTVAEPLLFHSWRRDQVKAVQWSGIVSQA